MATAKFKFIKKLFDSKKFCVIFSFIIAVALWMGITVIESPDSENTIGGLAVAIPIENTVVSEMGMDIIGDVSSYTASVTVKGPAYVVSDLSTEDILVTASVSNVTNSGTYTLELRATRQAGADGDFDIVSISPRTINVKFDYIDTKQFAVTAQAIGHKAVEGLVTDVPFVSDSNNATLNFKGSRTEIEKISKVVAVAEVNEVLSKSQSFDGVLKIYDEDNEELLAENYTITTADGLSAPEIKITVPIYKEKTVPIIARFINAPDAFKNTPISHTLEHTSLLISGPPETIDKISSISLSEIDFDNISENGQSFEAAVILPEGIKNKDNIDSVAVTIKGLEKYSVRTFNVTNLRVTAGSKNATTNRGARNVKIYGPTSVIKKLSASDFYVEVDLEGLHSGEHSVSARIKCTESNKVWQLGSYTVSVNIK